MINANYLSIFALIWLSPWYDLRPDNYDLRPDVTFALILWLGVKKTRISISLRPDMTLRGWLGVKHQVSIFALIWPFAVDWAFKTNYASIYFRPDMTLCGWLGVTHQVSIFALIWPPLRLTGRKTSSTYLSVFVAAQCNQRTCGVRARDVFLPASPKHHHLALSAAWSWRENPLPPSSPPLRQWGMRPQTASIMELKTHCLQSINGVPPTNLNSPDMFITSAQQK